MDGTAYGLKDFKIEKRKGRRGWSLEWIEEKGDSISFLDCSDEDIISLAESILFALHEKGLYEDVNQKF